MVPKVLEIVENALPRFEGAPEGVVSRKPALNVWSPKEVWGHLVDSAMHNHGRFVQLGLQDGAVFPGDDQDAWVSFQHWQERPWLEIVAFWKAYNLHLAWLIEHYQTHLEHHLDQIWQRLEGNARA